MKLNNKIIIFISSFVSAMLLSCDTLDENGNCINTSMTDLLTDRSTETSNGDYLNYGLYWLGRNSAQQKHIAGIDNPYYDPNKPIVIFFHGWAKGNSKADYKIDNLQFDRTGTWTQNSWLNRGWNVAIYHWAQWADEDEVQWAEAKIWCNNGPKGFRYRLSNGEFSTSLNPADTNKGVAGIAYMDIEEALKNHQNNNLRFVGHSLGVQLAVRVAELQVWDSSNDKVFKVNRLALLDPAYTKNGKTWLHGSWTGERVRRAIFDMIDHIDLVVEQYNTTGLDLNLFGVSMDSNQPLQDRICKTSLRPWYYGSALSLKIPEKHNACKYHYFWSMASNPPTECTIDWLKRRHDTGNDAASARTSDSRIKQMMNSGNHWDQVEGRFSENPVDDWFQIK